ncbi:hypothetical protein GCM10010910_28280 [Microbacterium nanhaiense]|uniref:Uncharacterized protein n=1 Tax=Microbacterium nanhaiense TaxID=1301026 RepID=A0ABQ2N579_9MICO|nr:hypothetical protein GCM10010910_28280 [Microbacterium nanhaiense]
MADREFTDLVAVVTGGASGIGAGIGATGDASANTDDEWARVLSINVTGIARVTSAALP